MGTSPQLTLILPFLTALGAILCSPLPSCFHGNAFSSFSALWFLYRFDQWEAPTETGRWEKEINQGISPSFLSTSEDVCSSNYQSPGASATSRLASCGPSSSALEHCHLFVPFLSSSRSNKQVLLLFISELPHWSLKPLSSSSFCNGLPVLNSLCKKSLE